QMDPANRLEALREAETDAEEGADFLIVKPSLSYLDVTREVKNQVNLPLVAYNVSGEFAMVKAAAENGWIDEKAVVLEKLTSMKRAGADLIVTYFAKDVAKWLQNYQQSSCCSIYIYRNGVIDLDFSKSVDAYKEAVDLMPGGVNSPVRAFNSVGMSPIFMDSGKGSKIVDIDGNEYIDYVLSWGPLIL